MSFIKQHGRVHFRAPESSETMLGKFKRILWHLRTANTTFSQTSTDKSNAFMKI